MLFKPGSPVNPEHKDKYLFLLAYAASVYETTDEVLNGTILKLKLQCNCCFFFNFVVSMVEFVLSLKSCLLQEKPLKQPTTFVAVHTTLSRSC